MAQLQGGDVGTLLVGDESGVAVPAIVEDLKLSAGVKPLGVHDQPRALGPFGEVDRLGQLCEVGALAPFALGVDRMAMGPRLARIASRSAPETS